jgi:2-dehydro-3-deoxyphosphogalactonate aldolase
MSTVALIDWGSSSLRVYSYSIGTIDKEPTLLLEDSSAGVLNILDGQFETILESALSRCNKENIFTKSSPVLMCGMIGSNRGWFEVPYVQTPATLNSLAAGCLRFISPLTGRTIIIVPGVSITSNANNQPDVMRGEETQVFGELFSRKEDLSNNDNDTHRLFVLPGTHSKWVLCDKHNKITSLQTAMTGELYSILSKNSILSRSLATDDCTLCNSTLLETLAFEEGLRCKAPLHGLFSIRTRDLFSENGIEREKTCISNRGLLSGMLISLELRDTISWLADNNTIDSSSLPQICIIGSGLLSERYSRAISIIGLGTTRVAQSHAAARGLILIGDVLGLFSTVTVPSSPSPSAVPSLSLSSNISLGFNNNIKTSIPKETLYKQRMKHLLDSLNMSPIVAILRGLEPTVAATIGLALYKSGIRVIEVPLNSPNHPLDSIKILLATFAHLPQNERPIIGAGTVLRVEDVFSVAELGGEILLAPNTDRDVIKAARAIGIPIFPGIATASEALASLDAGASGLKLFPCTTISTVTIEAFKAILPKDVLLLAVGGIGITNGKEYLTAGCIGIGIGSAIFVPGISIQEMEEKVKTIHSRLKGC